MQIYPHAYTVTAADHDHELHGDYIYEASRLCSINGMYIAIGYRKFEPRMELYKLIKFNVLIRYVCVTKLISRLAS